jgi:BMFP domain-containing protein YqiC
VIPGAARPDTRPPTRGKKLPEALLRLVTRSGDGDRPTGPVRFTVVVDADQVTDRAAGLIQTALRGRPPRVVRRALDRLSCDAAIDAVVRDGADLLAAQQRNVRLAARIQQLETRLSQLLGEHTWRSSGLGAPDDLDHLKQRIVMLEQQVIDLQLQLDEREQDLDAARATNRALMAQLNATACACSPPAS